MDERDGYVKTIRGSDLAEGEGRIVQAGSHWVALFRIGDAVYALDNACPHMAGPLGSGHAMKALNNYVAAAAFAATSEALLVGKRFGLEPGVMVEVLNASSGRSFHTDVVFPDHYPEHTGWRLVLG